MLTIKLATGFRTCIVEAQSFTLLHEHKDGSPGKPYIWTEITIHVAAGGDELFYVGHPPADLNIDPARLFDFAYIMNSNGKTVESVHFGLPKAA